MSYAIMIKHISFVIVGIFILSGCLPNTQPVPNTGKSQQETPIMDTSNKVLNIAHRGARSLAPENTIMAAVKGFESGADLWELDVTQSKDGVIVVIHDDTLERTSNAAEVFPNRRPWKVEDFTLAELKSLDFGSWFVKTDPFKTIASGVLTAEETKSYGGIKLPTLQEALQFTKEKKWRVNVEIKDSTGTPGDSTIVEKVTGLISEMGLVDSVIISSFNHTYLERSKKANPAIVTAALVNTPDRDPVALLNRLSAGAYNPNNKTLDYSQIAKLRDTGKDVFVWTVNDEPTMNRLIEARVSGIITDFPQLLRKILQK